MNIQLRSESRLYVRPLALGLTLALMLLTILGVALPGTKLVQAQDISHVVINEFMASNGQTIADEDGDFPDWIELHNPGGEAISLAGYGLSDDPGSPFRWVLPEVELAPNGFLLVWASGKNRSQPGGPLHTNFSISASGESLLLTHPVDGLLDQVDPIAVPRDMSYGRQPDGAIGWYFFDQPTPGSSNSTSPAYGEILNPPIFSHQAGFFSEPFSLTLTSTNPGVEIIFTLDGSIPDPDNLDGRTYTYKNQYPENPGDPFGVMLSDSFWTRVYTQPLSVVDRSTAPDKLTAKSTTYELNPPYFPQQPVFKGTVVRARAIKDGAYPSPVSTRTFFVAPEGRDRFSLPVVALSMQEDTLFDYYDGIYTAGTDFDTWRAANPNVPVHALQPANWRRDTEFAAHLELWEAGDPQLAMGQDIGYRIHGAATRSYFTKSLRLYARSAYGESSFDYPIFPDQPYDSYRRLILRNSGNDHAHTRFRDAAFQTIVAHLNFDTQAYRPAVVFLNGEYWGIHNLRERYDRHYLERVYGIDPDNVDILENNRRVEEGDAVHYNAMMSYIQANGLTQETHYDYIKTQMDIDNYLDYQIAQIYTGNTDWPHNNNMYWRLRTDDYAPGAPYGHDGRWRWLMFDTDHGLGWAHSPNVNSLEWASRTGQWSTELFRGLLSNESFEIAFVNRFADLLNTTFLPGRMTSIILTLKLGIEPEMAEHIVRWRQPDSMNTWHSRVNVMINYAHQRPNIQRQHIRNKFAIPGEYSLNVSVSHPEHGYVRVNTIELLSSTPGVAENPYPWSGIYFHGVPVELEAIPYPGYQFVAWEGLPDGTPGLTIQAFAEDVTLTAVFEEIPQQELSLLHYWHFNNLPSGTLTSVPADYTALANAFITYPGTGTGYMDRVNDEGTDLNARLGEPAGRALRVRNPSDTRELLLTLPTTGYQNIVLRYAATRTSNGAQEQTLFYRTADNADWIQFGDTFAVSQDFNLFEFDFTGLADVENNAEFSVRILFGGSNAPGSSGNNRFDNITLEGIPVPVSNNPPIVAAPLSLQTMIADGGPLVIDLSDVFADPDEDPLTFSGLSGDTNVALLTVAGNYATLSGQYQGDAAITIYADDGYNDPVATTFRVLVYPSPYPLGNGPFAFNDWDADTPERVFPDHMLFLQSDRSDTELDTPLLYPYFIPHDDYAAGDTVGFPYNNASRTRINGLGEDGISFINTGRARDLGGALVALDTRGMHDLTVGWLAETLLQNSRVYGLRLQYRVGIDDAFSDLLVDGQPLEYIAGPDGDWRAFDQISLPLDIMDQSYVQLLWRYYHVSGTSGQRSQLRLDDIAIADSVIHSDVRTAVLSAPFAPGTFYPFAGTINCGGVTFTNPGNINTVHITLTLQYPTADFDALPRYYEIIADGNGYEAQLQLCYTQSELQAAGIAPTDETNLRAFRWNGAAWEMFEGGVDPVAKVVTADSVNQFSIWSLGPKQPALAVTLASFETRCVDEAVVIEWETIMETNTAGFNIWRGETPVEPLVQINAQLIPSQNPGSTLGAVYEHVDPDASPGVMHYYWLQDMALDGTMTLHGPVSGICMTPTAVSIGELRADSTPPRDHQPLWLVLLAATAVLPLGYLAGRSAHLLSERIRR